MRSRRRPCKLGRLRMKTTSKYSDYVIIFKKGNFWGLPLSPQFPAIIHFLIILKQTLKYVFSSFTVVREFVKLVSCIRQTRCISKVRRHFINRKINSLFWFYLRIASWFTATGSIAHSLFFFPCHYQLFLKTVYLLQLGVWR